MLMLEYDLKRMRGLEFLFCTLSTENTFIHNEHKKHKNSFDTSLIDQLKVPKSEIFDLLDISYLYITSHTLQYKYWVGAATLGTTIY
jgi:hypothetical protein